jgi:hypothetical protein
MAEFVLAAGAWLGSWVWDDLVPELWAAGHGAAEYGGQGLTEGQVARVVGGHTPHPGASLIEPAVLARPLGELPATYIKCRHDAARA